MNFRAPQTPGIDGLANQFTANEATKLSQFAGIAGVQGDIIYHNGTSWVRLAAGVSGETLQTQGAGANPIWAAGAGSGDMILASVQTVTGAKTFNDAKLILAGVTSGTTVLKSGAIAGTSVITLPVATDTLVGKATTDTLTNKTLDADGTGNSITNIENADIKAAAAIAVNKLAALTASEIVITDASGFIASAAVATYPSLTELTYVKGVTSAIQTQLGTKAPSTSPTFATSVTGSYLTASEMLITGASKEIISAPVATYPSLTELTYVKGVTSAIQTQFTGKADVAQTFYIGTTQVAINRASAALTLAGLTLTTADIGTPSAGVLTNCTGLPATSIVDDTTTALGIGTLELGHASDTTVSRSAAGVIAVEGVVIPSISSTNTLTNKRVTKRTGTTTSHATPTINTDNVDFYSITAQTEAITSMTTNLSGTPTEAQTLWIAITGTAARAITWGASFEASTVALPTTTVTTARLDVGFIWNTVTSKWRCVASA
jgi:maltodextrin utilization protein YvdJ